MLARNVRTPYGEIDIIAEKEDGIAFVEVKTRTNLSFGYPETGVTHKKLEHMALAARSYMDEHPEYAGKVWQIDVIAVQRVAQSSGGIERVEIEHFENITG